MAKVSEVFILGGCGHVGLPLGITLADAGVSVRLYDLDPGRVRLVREGRMPFIEHGAQPILKRVLGRTLRVAESLAEMRPASCVIVTIGTPVDEYHNPRTGPMFNLMKSIVPYLRKGQHVIVRSTVCPGANRELSRFLKSMRVDVHLSYCPERIAQGFAIVELTRLPQIVSGFSEEGVQFASSLFERLGCRILTLSVEEAELAKLYLNAWRYIQFAIANQFYMMATQRGLDFFKIHEGMTKGYDRAKDFPLPGFTAGPCLLKDTLQLSAVSNQSFLLGHAAMMINEGLPQFLVDNLKRSFDLSKETIGILGMAFKGNIDDIRDSLAYKLRKILTFYGAKVLCSDPFVKDLSFVSPEILLKRSRIVIVGAPHEAYRRLKIPSGKCLLDVWGFLRHSSVAERIGTVASANLKASMDGRGDARRQKVRV